MKSLEELAAIRDKMRSTVLLREGHNDIRIVVGMATCGIAAGARPVLSTFVEEVSAQGLSDKATVTQTGCIGICKYEPVVEVYPVRPGKGHLCPHDAGEGQARRGGAHQKRQNRFGIHHRKREIKRP